MSEISETISNNALLNPTEQNDNVSENIRDLIRQDKKYAEQRKFESVKAELQLAFAAPEQDYTALTAADIFKRNEHLS